MSEHAYYDAVKKWLLSPEGRCFEAATDTGIRLVRADAIGVRHTGGDLAPDYEVVAVEVKTDASFFRSASQASGYKVFAHRCYLAQYERGQGDFTPEELEIATSLGIGLIKIRSQQVNGIQEYLSAPLSTPNPRFTLQTLEVMGLSSCIFCRGLFRGNFKSNTKRADRQNTHLMLRRAIEQTLSDELPTGFVFWSDSAAEMKAAAGDSNKKTARRYICPDCLVNIIGPLFDYTEEANNKAAVIKQTNSINTSK